MNSSLETRQSHGHGRTDRGAKSTREPLVVGSAAHPSERPQDVPAAHERAAAGSGLILASGAE